MISKITTNIYVGTIWDAIHDRSDWGLYVCVAEWDNYSDEEQHDLMYHKGMLIHAPFMVYNTKDWFKDDLNIVQDCHADTSILDHISDILTSTVNLYKEVGSQKKILVFCAAGVERSPLAVIWHLHRNHGDSIEGAYNFVKQQRPIVENRLSWIKGE